MESAIRMVQWVVYALGLMVWLVAVGFIGYRIHQLNTLVPVSAEVIDAHTRSYTSTSYMRDATGHNRETPSRMYSADATVRYAYQGKSYTAMASHDVGISIRWFQDRLTRQWQPGTRIRIHVDPSQPDQPLAGLGSNLNTFAPAIGLAMFGCLILASSYGIGRLQALMTLFR